uniref:NADH-ubiquinone oxidoreductase chain 2 n=1 Tax=Henosepilachna vigintioctopunctata TaxID=420089 RepID=A0A411DAG3_9CUCU|nr:NADH dehydrogenase subunit 2 [Henosepilachna vigintioctopunctata]QAY82216.1 NADH dehydrogenase subunit 2 [Henosepilachna vigintioctopunctata]
MKLSKILFLSTMIMGTLISISSFSWFSMWMGLEVNMLSFIPLMNEKNNPLSSEASFKYFIIQAISSMLILFNFLSFLISKEYLTPLNFLLEIIFNSALLMKLGMAPFHFWLPEIMEGISWMNTFFLLTWQKIAPMILIMYNSQMNLFLISIIILSLLISGLKNWNQTSIKKILAFSSINHMGWMLSIILLNQSLWSFYFIFYVFISFSMIWMFKNSWTPSIQDFFKILNSNKSMKMFFMFNFFSLGGLPPFLGFFPKWMILKVLWMENYYILATLMVFLTLITLFVYIRLLNQTMTFKISESKMLFTSPKNFILNFSNFCNLSGLIIFSLALNL